MNLALSGCVCIRSLTSELGAERRCDGGSLDQRCLADVFQVFDLGDAVVVDEVVVLLGGRQSAADPIAQILHTDVLVIARRYSLHQLCSVLRERDKRRAGED